MNGPLDGSADEVNRLLVAVRQWAERAMPAPPSGHGGPECQWCPLCQLASALRGEHPELTDRLAEAGAAVTGAVRALLESAARSGDASADDVDTRSAASSPPPTAPQPPAGPPDRPARRPRPHIQHIDLDDTAPED